MTKNMRRAFGDVRSHARLRANDGRDFERHKKKMQVTIRALEVTRLVPKRMTGAGLESEVGMGLRR